jgi:hypothetical protein
MRSLLLVTAVALMAACGGGSGTPDRGATGGATGSGAGGQAGNGDGGAAGVGGGGGASGSGGNNAGSGGASPTGSGGASPTGSGGGGASGSAGAGGNPPRPDSGVEAGARADAGAPRDASVASDASTIVVPPQDAGPVPAGVSALFPPNGGRAICPDPALHITFAAPPTLGTAGRIQVFNAQTSAAVATVDMAAATTTNTIGGMALNILRPAYVDGNDAVITLPSRALTYNQTYYVTVDSGAIRGPGNAALAITGTTAWRFTTAAAAPTNLTAITVATDGAGAFCSVQGALDAVPAANANRATITVNTGIYHEIVYFTGKNNITLHGQDRAGTIIQNTNNDLQNPGTRPRTLFGVDNSTGLIIENLTIHNLTPQGGSQAEGLRVQNCDQCVIRNANLLSLQDTLLAAGRVYVDNSLIAGNVDFVWGTGTVYFNNCEIRTVVRSGAVVMSRNTTNYGYVFVDSRITSDPGITGSVLARIDAGVYPQSHVAYINCEIGSHITAAGWQLTAGTATPALRFWEFQSHDAAGNPINTSQRLAGLTPITAAQAAMMRDPTVVLNGWQPPTQ